MFWNIGIPKHHYFSIWKKWKIVLGVPILQVFYGDLRIAMTSVSLCIG